MTPRTVARQAPLSMGFSRPEYGVGGHALLQGIIPTQGLNPGLPHGRRNLYHLSHQGSPAIFKPTSNYIILWVGPDACVQTLPKGNLAQSCIFFSFTFASLGILEKETCRWLLLTETWRRQWHPTRVLLPGESHGRRSLVGCRLWGRTELDTTEST